MHQSDDPQTMPSVARGQSGTTALSKYNCQARTFVESSSLMTFVLKYNETVFIKSDSIYLFDTKYLSIALRSGPLISKQFSQAQNKA